MITNMFLSIKYFYLFRSVSKVDAKLTILDEKICIRMEWNSSIYFNQNPHTKLYDAFTMLKFFLKHI